MTVRRAETLREVQQVTKPDPLRGEELDVFYVPTDPARDPDWPVSSVLRDKLYRTPPPFRLLFASHPGAGKSTELIRLMRDAAADFWFVFFSVREELDIATLTHVELILALMDRLFAQGQEENLIQDQRVVEPVRRWLSEVVSESRITREESVGAEVGLGVDGPISQILGLLARVKAAFSLSHESAETVRQVLKPRIVDLRNSCNQVIVEISNNVAARWPGRRLLIIVDDTDKLDIPLAQQLFVQHTGLLADLQSSIIFTVPLFLIHSADRPRLESYFETLTLPMIKTHTSDGNRFEDGRRVLQQVVTSRLVPDLIEPDALELAIDKTGGVLRDLLRVIQFASTVAHYAEAPNIRRHAVRSGLDRLKHLYRNSAYGRGPVSTTDLYQKMLEVVRAPSNRVPLDDTLQLLLYTQAVIEYNGSGWYQLHPLMRETLKEMGMLDDLAA